MKWYMRSFTRRVILMLVTAFLVGFLSTRASSSVDAATGAVAGVSQAMGVSEVVHAVSDLPFNTAEGKATKARATVVHSVDGDTFDVQLKSGQEASVRLYGIDSPEVHRPNYPVEACGLDAAAAGRKLSEGKAVKLTTDPTQDTVDRYGRLLRYAEINGKDYGLTMLKKGWVAPYVYDNNPVEKIDAYRKAAAFAESKGRGVWGKCGGNFHSAGDEPWSGD